MEPTASPRPFSGHLAKLALTGFQACTGLSLESGGWCLWWVHRSLKGGTEGWLFVGMRSMVGARMELVHAGWPTHPAWDGLRVGREGKGVGIWLVSSVKMMRRMKLLGGFGVGVTARPGQCLAGGMPSVCWLRLSEKRCKYPVTLMRSCFAAECLGHLH